MLDNSPIFAENNAATPSDFRSNDTSGGDDGGGDRFSGGSRWPREETLALLKIRSEMDSAFRDSALKAPLWDEVSRYAALLFSFFFYSFTLLTISSSVSSLMKLN